MLVSDLILYKSECKMVMDEKLKKVVWSAFV